MYSVYTKKHKKKKKSFKKEYSEVMQRRIDFVQERIKREQEEKSKLKYF